MCTYRVCDVQSQNGHICVVDIFYISTANDFDIIPLGNDSGCLYHRWKAGTCIKRRRAYNTK